MKRIGMVILALFLSLGVFAQENLFQQGDKVINFGLGIGTTLYSGSFYKTKIPPVSVSFELGLKEDLFIDNLNLGVGGYLGFTSSKWESTWLGLGKYGWNYTNIIIGGRGAVHYPFIEKLDTYTGLLLGLNIVSSKYFGDPTWNVGAAAKGGIVWSWYAGGRYYFTDNLAAMGELGYGVSFLNLGLAFKLK